MRTFSRIKAGSAAGFRPSPPSPPTCGSTPATPRAADEAHTLIRQALTGTGDIIPGPDTLIIRLDPLPTRRATTALTELCEHLTATGTRYPGTDLLLRYQTNRIGGSRLNR